MVKKSDSRALSAEPEQVAAAAAIPAGYGEWLSGIERRVVAARQRAALAVNAELVQLFK